DNMNFSTSDVEPAGKKKHNIFSGAPPFKLG
ncbi:hypothetical protein C5S39_07770, partial [Candidatus Methanophagaceae archaeon]